MRETQIEFREWFTIHPVMDNVKKTTLLFSFLQ